MAHTLSSYFNAPLEDAKNKQLVVFMDIVSHLMPKFVLVENVVNLLKFADGFLGRYAMGCLVGMGYQARMGMVAAGCKLDSKKALVLGDAISDFPHVKNDEGRDGISYDAEPQTEFQ
ncbi:hypothetical protein SASPL_152534 [Salvia splendens]|uniref:DNA (Cytosine-5)-methyltransferase 1 n=1 Tax=Salvia splendens TaxID=180675 RepID=A0A8X8Z1C8_SALSN|nr:hypothetical protein SASPL_152534 [Salvia splendens]